ncbi:hypothetical protein EQW78_16960 [Oerskovia turbata]|uniref:Uncharacterized protein n=1 Tax=Oerskovia turbata TaxID=1713 RepID=A0A4V1N476_9CELL|nr:hypothetical protein [Oerskovia turbata]RXR27351.1 hypothetical protein EQW73_02675 [Oerskovia turbata]RXR31196.1 hypothetical protein EQW78_16960 [Oerskovia turbata]
MGNPYAPPRPGAQKPTDEARRPSPPPVQGPPAPPAHDVPPGQVGPGRPGGGPPAPGEPPVPVDPDTLRATTRQVLHFGLLMLVTLVTSSLAFPWRVSSLFFAVVTIVFGVRAMRAVWRARLGGALLPAVAVGLGLTATMSLSMLGGLAMWDVELDNQQCLDGAITVAAQQECAVQYEQAREQWTKDRLGQ